MSEIQINDLGMFAVQYVTSKDALKDNPETPIHMRWEFVLKNAPLAHKRYIYEDFEDAWQAAYASNTRDEIAAGLELARLQYYFYRILHDKGHGGSHINAYYITNAEKWVMKLTDRFNALKPTRIVKGAVVPHKIDVVKHTWLH